MADLAEKVHPADPALGVRVRDRAADNRDASLVGYADGVYPVPTDCAVGVSEGEDLSGGHGDADVAGLAGIGALLQPNQSGDGEASYQVSHCVVIGRVDDDHLVVPGFFLILERLEGPRDSGSRVEGWNDH